MAGSKGCFGHKSKGLKDTISQFLSSVSTHE